MDKYLILLLKEVNTIIIPGIGALTIVNQVTGEVMFMSFMKFDDEKLATYIAEKEGWNLNDAKNLVAKYVRDIEAKLAVGDTYDMYQFGSLSKNKDGEIEFTSWEGNNSNISAESIHENIISEVVVNSQAEETISKIGDIEVLETQIQNVEITDDFTSEVDATIISKATEKQIDSLSDNPISSATEKIDLNITEEPISEMAEVLPLKEIKEKINQAIVDGDESDEKPKKVTAKSEKSVDPKIKDEIEKSEKSVSDKVSNVIEKVTEIPEVEKVIEDTSKIIPAVPAMLSVEEQLNDDLDVAPINEIKPIIIKPILEKTQSDEKRKKRRFPVFLWVILAIFIGGGIYAALNYDNIKQHILFLADHSTKSKIADNDDKNQNNQSSTTDDDDNGSQNESDESLIENDLEDISPEAEQEKIAPEDENIPISNASNSEFSVNKDLPIQIIVGSFQEKSNAERKVKSLKAEGFLPEIIGQYDGLYFVSLGSFNSLSEVKAKASEISLVGSYWVFKK